MHRDEIEELVYASLGRHLRVTCVLGLLFLGIGFVLGHMVAAQHTRAMNDRWAARTDQLARQIAQVESRLKAEPGKGREQAPAPKSTPVTTPSSSAPAVSSTYRMKQVKTSEAALTPPVIVTEPVREGSVAPESKLPLGSEVEKRREQVTHCIQDAEREKIQIQSELEPYLDRRMMIEANVVSRAVNRLLDAQVSQLKGLNGDGPSVVSREVGPYFQPTDIAPISAESEPRQATAAPLLQIPNGSTAAADEMTEAVTLTPLPHATETRIPAAAEPSHRGADPFGSARPAISNPPRRSIFISGRKPVNLSGGNQTAAQ